jgi:hypothetical protein
MPSEPPHPSSQQPSDLIEVACGVLVLTLTDEKQVPAQTHIESLPMKEQISLLQQAHRYRRITLWSILHRSLLQQLVEVQGRHAQTLGEQKALRLGELGCQW